MSTATSTSRLSRRTRATVSEECYASGVIRLVGDRTSGLGTSDGRKKTSRGSSNDEDPMAEDGFVNEAFRAGGPQLCGTPVLTFPVPQGHPMHPALTNEAQISHAVVCMLNDRNFQVEAIFFCLRQSQFDYDSACLTLFIQATKATQDNTWIDMARQVYEFLISRDIQQCSVEIADRRAFQPDHFFPLKTNDEIFSHWYSVASTIMQWCDLSEITSIGCFRIGVSDKWEDNPPTVFVTVERSTEADWKVTRDLIVDILEINSLPMVAVKIQRDRVLLNAADALLRPRLPETALQPAAQVGQSLGVWEDPERSGTFGGFLEIQDNSGQWNAFGVTCSHCVIDENAISLRNTGVSSSDNIRQTLEVASPSLLDLNREIDYCTNMVDEIAAEPLNTKVKEALKDSDSFVFPWEQRYYDEDQKRIRRFEAAKDGAKLFRDTSSHYLGRVFAASGEKLWHRMGNSPDSLDTIIDWALVEIPKERMGDNKIFTFGRPGDLFDFDEDKRLQDWMPTPLEAPQRLYKCGRSSGYTTGRYGGVKTAMIAKEIVNGEEKTKATWEHAVLGSPGAPFCLPGDSGSLVFDSHASVAGLVFGGAEEAPIGYFTHHADLVENIMQVTGTTGVRVFAG